MSSFVGFPSELEVKRCSVLEVRHSLSLSKWLDFQHNQSHDSVSCSLGSPVLMDKRGNSPGWVSERERGHMEERRGKFTCYLTYLNWLHLPPTLGLPQFSTTCYCLILVLFLQHIVFILHTVWTFSVCQNVQIGTIRTHNIP